MKYTLILIASILCFSCKKINLEKYHFTTDEITETDSLGNLVGHIQQGDWQLKPIAQANDFDKDVFSNVYELSEKARNNPNTLEDSIYDFRRYNLNCTDTFAFKLVAYPNPGKLYYPNAVGPIPFCKLDFKLETNLNIARYLVFFATKNKDHVGIATSGSYGNNNLPIEFLPWVSPPDAGYRDYIVYYIIYTTGGCVFYGKGNIIGC